MWFYLLQVIFMYYQTPPPTINVHNDTQNNIHLPIRCIASNLFHIMSLAPTTIVVHNNTQNNTKTLTRCITSNNIWFQNLALGFKFLSKSLIVSYCVHIGIDSMLIYPSWYNVIRTQPFKQNKLLMSQIKWQLGEIDLRSITTCWLVYGNN